VKIGYRTWRRKWVSTHAFHIFDRYGWHSMYRSSLNAGVGAASVDEIGAVKVTLYLEVQMNFHSYFPYLISHFVQTRHKHFLFWVESPPPPLFFCPRFPKGIATRLAKWWCVRKKKGGPTQVCAQNSVFFTGVDDVCQELLGTLLVKRIFKKWD
jgi:hypothetical protein